MRFRFFDRNDRKLEMNVRVLFLDSQAGMTEGLRMKELNIIDLFEENRLILTSIMSKILYFLHFMSIIRNCR